MFDSRDRTNTQGLKITAERRYFLCPANGGLKIPPYQEIFCDVVNCLFDFNPFVPGKLVEQLSSHCLAIKSSSVPQSCLQLVHFAAF